MRPLNFRMLPAELRLRVLEHTHLGPPSRADYDPYFDSLLIHDGKLVKAPSGSSTEEWKEWSSRQPPRRPPPAVVHRLAQSLKSPDTSAPFRRRVLPMALFLVDRTMYREASDVFYPNALFTFYGDDLGAALRLLDRLPRPSGLARLRRLEFVLTEAHCEGWTPGAPSGSLKHHAGGRAAARADYRAGWRAVLALVAQNADLPRLRLAVDMADCPWTYVRDALAWGDFELDLFRFVYDFQVGVAGAVCAALAGSLLGAVRFRLCPFEGLEPWLEREVMGCRNGYGVLPPPPERPRVTQEVPGWHDMDQRLEGSNYHPDAREVQSVDGEKGQTEEPAALYIKT